MWWVCLASKPRFWIWLIGGALILAAAGRRLGFPAPSDAERVEKARRNLQVLRTALELFRRDCGRYPHADEGLAALVERPADAPGWQGPYIETLWPDPWRAPFRYAAEAGGLRLWSDGPDGVTGSDDDIAAPPPDYRLLVEALRRRTANGSTPDQNGGPVPEMK